MGHAVADNDSTEKADGDEAKAPKSKRKLIIMIAAAALLLGGGVGGYFMFFGGKHEVHEAEAAAPKPPVFLDVPDVLVNLAQVSGERQQYLKLKVVLEIKDQPQLTQIQPVIPRVMDVFQTYVRELRPADLNGSSGIFRLKEELTRRVNAAIAPGQVNAVLFKEILVQ